MPRRIILHPGFHKTGTSTLQATLRQNRKLLKPYMKIVLGGEFVDLKHAARGYSTLHNLETLAKTEVRFAELLQSQPDMPRRTLVVSSEELSGHLPGRPGIARYDAAATLAESYVRILRTVHPEAEIILFYTLRDAASWMQSAYWQHVKSSNMTMEIGEFAERFATAGDLERIVAEIAKTSDVRVETAGMEVWRDNPLGPLAPLLALCDVPEDQIALVTPAKATNIRPAPNVLLALLEANRAYADPKVRLAKKAAILAEHEVNRRD